MTDGGANTAPHTAILMHEAQRRMNVNGRPTVLFVLESYWTL